VESKDARGLLLVAKLCQFRALTLAPTSGQLAELRVEQGDRVKTGQIMTRMDNADIQNETPTRVLSESARAGSRREEIGQLERVWHKLTQLSPRPCGSRSEEIEQTSSSGRQLKHG